MTFHAPRGYYCAALLTGNFADAHFLMERLSAVPRTGGGQVAWNPGDNILPSFALIPLHRYSTENISSTSLPSNPEEKQTKMESTFI